MTNDLNDQILCLFLANMLYFNILSLNCEGEVMWFGLC